MRIDEMPAGRECDALVAEKVMGWAIHSRNTAWWVKVTDENEVTTEVMGFTYGKDRFAPSTDIAAAWEVFEKILDPNRSSIHPCGNGQEGLWWAIYYDDEMIAYANTTPLAICRAALKAMGVTEC